MTDYTTTGEIVMGIDPGLATFGYGILEIDAGGYVLHVAHGQITTKAESLLEHRLLEISQTITEIFSTFEPGYLCIEQVYSHGDRGDSVHKIIRGDTAAVLAYASTRPDGHPTQWIAPQTWKNTMCGYGNAQPSEYRRAAQQYFGLPSKPDEHAAAALGVALWGAMQVKEQRILARR